MAATGFTPIYLYASGTTGHIPLAANLTNTTNGSEIALNYADGNLFFKNASNAVITTPLLQASGSQNGWLSSTDWTTFNSKQAALVSGSNIKTVGGNNVLGSGDAFAKDCVYGVTQQILISGATNPNQLMSFGYDTTSNYGFVQPVLSGTGYKDFVVCPSGGNLLVGTTASNAKVVIANDGAYGSPQLAILGKTNTNQTLQIGYDTSSDYGYIQPLVGGVGYKLLVLNASGGGVSIGDTTDPGAGNLRLGTGNLVIGTSGKGIDFSATAGTGTSELLADYEEGTWTPTGNNITYSSASGTYTKTGRIVTLFYNVVFPTTSDTNQARLNGLPYVSTNTTANQSIGDSDTALSVDGNSFGRFLNVASTAYKSNADLSGKTIVGFVVYNT